MKKIWNLIKRGFNSFDFTGERWEEVSQKLTDDMSTNEHRGNIPEVNVFLIRRIVLFITLSMFAAVWYGTHSLFYSFSAVLGLWILRASWCVKLVPKNNYWLIEPFKGFGRIVVGQKWTWLNEWDKVADKENYKLRKWSLENKDIDLPDFSGSFNVHELLQIGPDNASLKERKKVFYDRYYSWDSVEERTETIQASIDSFVRRIFERAKNLKDVQNAKEADFYNFYTVKDEDRTAHEATLKKGGYFHSSEGKNILFTGPDLTDEYKDATAKRYAAQEAGKAAKNVRILKAEGDKKAKILESEGEKEATENIEEGRVNAVKKWKDEEEGLGLSNSEALAQRNVETKRKVLVNAKDVTIFDDDADAKRDRPQKVILTGGKSERSKQEKEPQKDSTPKEGENK